jgi:hypothetical protein
MPASTHLLHRYSGNTHAASQCFPFRPARIRHLNIRMSYLPGTLACDLLIAIYGIPNMRVQAPLTTVNRQAENGSVSSRHGLSCPFKTAERIIPRGTTIITQL